MEYQIPSDSILIVDDNPDDAELAMIALKKNGIKAQLRVASDASEAMAYALGRDSLRSGETMINPPSLILLDLKLPGKSGLEVLKELRASPLTRYVPIVVLTTSMLEEDMIKSYENGANSFVRKPIDFLTFLAQIELICHYWLKTNLRPRPRFVQGIIDGYPI